MAPVGPANRGDAGNGITLPNQLRPEQIETENGDGAMPLPPARAARGRTLDPSSYPMTAQLAVARA